MAIGSAAILAAGRSARADGVSSMTIAGAGNDSTLPAVYAANSGLFKRAGLDVKVLFMNSGGAVAAAVAGGDVQAGHSSLMSLIEAHARGVPLTLVAPSGEIDASDVGAAQIAVRADSSIHSGRDLNGKTISSPALNDFDAIAVRAWIDKTGGDSSTAKFIELSQTAAVQALQEQRIDATSLATPAITEALTSGKVRALGNAFSAVASRYMQLAWFASRDYSTNHPNAIRSFATAIHDAELYCNTHHTETVGLVAEFTKFDPNVIRRMVRIKYALYLDPALIQPLIDTAARYGAIPQSFKAQEMISDLALKPATR
jgi:NitT/TauT family transport system substrate-binding protein